MTPDIAKRLALVFPTAALQEAGVTGVAGVADVTRYAQKPQELRQLRPLRHENDNAGKMPDEGVTADVASLLPFAGAEDDRNYSAASNACASAISGISGVGAKPSSAGARTAWASARRPVDW
jgi:hypothetical protein